MNRLLSVRGLKVGFGRGNAAKTVVHGVDFDLEPGETLAIVGESGSGKSVTALSINRLIDDGGGRILGGRMEFTTARGEVIDLACATDRRMETIRGSEIGMIFQEPMTSLNPVIPIGRQIEEAFRLQRGLGRAAARLETLNALERVRIPDAERRLGYYPHQLSGGMLQRVMIAMALAANPRLLIADEPTTALDVSVQAQIMALLAELRRETGTGMIFITHDMGLVAGIADRVLVMIAGRVVEQGRLDDIFDRPRHPYTQHLLQAVPHFSHGRKVRRHMSPAGREMARPALKVEGLTVRFPATAGLLRRPVGAIHAVEGIGFDVMPGETLAVVGESGSGKSTTARALLGLVKPSSGTFSVMSAEGLARRKPMQMVFQNPYASLNPRLDVEGLLAEPVLAGGVRPDASTRQRMVALLERVGLPADSLRRFPHEFSGGQRQRLCIARALMVDPSVLVLDEAVSALDVSVQARVLDLLIDLQNELKLAYLFVSHDMAVVERIAHRIAVLYAGRIVEIGRADAVLSNPRHDYTRRLIAAVPTTERRRDVFRLETAAVPSLLRPRGYEPPEAVWQVCGEDHQVLVERAAAAKEIR
ncbi:ABC transporter ATP-binding protein [Rhizobium sp. CSW-27]|uniref:ABC transporter ATP-binding protein n=1 Tax=Rhizobium sp. CSW-27 TaxID=2839985 RepID=UPI001C0270A0|nr:ABC transporter ATP-binding protein [Rhizobium sp. CSW-27]MBT9369703.1 ABC transporter ATP-binding protein [Rhizobium sp. CSW-27]